MGVSGQLHTLTILSQRKETPVLIGLKVLKNPRASPEALAEKKKKKKTLTLLGVKPQAFSL
jgi:hypothetical protein